MCASTKAGSVQIGVTRTLADFYWQYWTQACIHLNSWPVLSSSPFEICTRRIWVPVLGRKVVSESNQITLQKPERPLSNNNVAIPNNLFFYVNFNQVPKSYFVTHLWFDVELLDLRGYLSHLIYNHEWDSQSSRVWDYSLITKSCGTFLGVK